MKNVLLTWIAVTCFSVTAMAQGVNHISISPANPTASDTISIVSDFSYDGNCSYGLVYVDTFTIGSTIHVLPLYCGYGSSTLCNSIDTFRIGPYPGGSYSIQIQYHQGSVCPISGFDAIIAQFDSTLIIGGPSGLPGNIADNSSIGIYPNPANNQLTIAIGNAISVNHQLKIINAFGQLVFQRSISQKQFDIDLSSLTNGMYFISITDNQNNIIENRKIVIQ